MTTKNDEQLRAEFEAEIRENWGFAKLERVGGDYIDPETQGLWGLWNRRAALQSKAIPADDWFDMFMELARAVVVANRLFAVSPTTTKQKVAADAAIALQEHARRHPALQSQDREDAERYRSLRAAAINQDVAFIDAAQQYGFDHFPSPSKPTADEFDASIDHARRVEGEGE